MRRPTLPAVSFRRRISGDTRKERHHLLPRRLPAKAFERAVVQERLNPRKLRVADAVERRPLGVQAPDLPVAVLVGTSLP